MKNESPTRYEASKTKILPITIDARKTLKKRKYEKRKV